MTPEQIALVCTTWNMLAPNASAAAELFYDRLFKLDPGLRRLFAGTDWNSQRSKLVSAINFAVSSLKQPEQLLPILTDLGARHATYGVKDADYETVGRALIDTLAQGLDESWSADAEEAWKEVYGIVAKTMRDAQRTVPARKQRIAG